MTDIPTQPQSLSLPTAAARGLRFAATLLKHLPGARGLCRIDTCRTSDHTLKDLGLRRTQDVPQVPSLDYIWR